MATAKTPGTDPASTRTAEMASLHLVSAALAPYQVRPPGFLGHILRPGYPHYSTNRLVGGGGGGVNGADVSGGGGADFGGAGVGGDCGTARSARGDDARFKKYGFLHTFNADEAAKALEDELSDCLSLKTSQKPPTPPEPKRTRFEFLKFKTAAKPASNRADSIIMLNQYLTKPNAEEDVDPLIYWKRLVMLDPEAKYRSHSKSLAW
ncbi:hypothetical protein ACLKA7_005103 [Drosophila subpalustris]